MAPTLNKKVISLKLGSDFTTDQKIQNKKSVVTFPHFLHTKFFIFWNLLFVSKIDSNLQESRSKSFISKLLLLKDIPERAVERPVERVDEELNEIMRKFVSWRRKELKYALYYVILYLQQSPTHPISPHS